VWWAYSHEFPRTNHSRIVHSCLDLDENGADVGDSPDVQTFANLIAYAELHVATLRMFRRANPGASRPRWLVF